MTASPWVNISSMHLEFGTSNPKFTSARRPWSVMVQHRCSVLLVAASTSLADLRQLMLFRQLAWHPWAEREDISSCDAHVLPAMLVLPASRRAPHVRGALLLRGRAARGLLAALPLPLVAATTGFADLRRLVLVMPLAWHRGQGANACGFAWLDPPLPLWLVLCGGYTTPRLGRSFPVVFAAWCGDPALLQTCGAPAALRPSPPSPIAWLASDGGFPCSSGLRFPRGSAAGPSLRLRGLPCRSGGNRGLVW